MLVADDWEFLQRALTLSPRELQIVQHVYDDHTELDIAVSLGISVHTVHTYVGRLYRKLGVASRCQLLRSVMDAYLLSARPETERGRRRLERMGSPPGATPSQGHLCS